MQKKIRVDFHSHTRYSEDCITPVWKLIQIARREGMDRLVITDHNSIKGALEAKAMDPDLIIVGEEIQTTHGEFLAAFVIEEVPMGLEPLEALRRLKEQGAFISVSHPFDPFRSGWTRDDLEELTGQVDAVEVFNARCLSARMNTQAFEFAIRHQLPGTAGSDAHLACEVGRASLRLPEFVSASELRVAIHDSHVEGRLTPQWVRIGSSYARAMHKIRKDL